MRYMYEDLPMARIRKIRYNIINMLFLKIFSKLAL